MEQDCPPASDRMVCVLWTLSQVEHVAELVSSDELAGDSLNAFLLGLLSIVVERWGTAAGAIQAPARSEAGTDLAFSADEKILDLVP